MTIQVRRDNQMLGRFVLAESKTLLASGTLKESDWACAEGSQIWVRLGALVASEELPVNPPKATTDEPAARVRQPSPVWRFLKKLALFGFLILVSLVVLGVGAYIGYPYYTVKSLRSALKSGDIQKVERNVDVTSVNRSLREQLPRRLTAVATDSRLNAYAAGLVNASFVQRCLNETLGTGAVDKWISLFRETSKPDNSLDGKMNGDRSRDDGSFRVKNLQCQRVTQGFSGTPFKFRVNFETAALEIEAWYAEYSSVSPLALRCNIPRGSLVFALDGIRWRLAQIDLPEKITVLAQLVRISAADLEGSWSAQDSRINLDFHAEDQRISESTGEIMGDSGLEILEIQSVQIRGNTASFSWKSRHANGQAAIEKQTGDALKLHWEPAGGEASSTAMVRNSTIITAAELAGLWQAEGMQAASLDLELAADQTLRGTVEYRSNNRGALGNITDAAIAGRRLRLTWTGPNATETVTVIKQPDGTYLLIEPGDDLASARAGSLRKTAGPMPAWNLEEIDGRWESDIHRLVEIKVSGNQVITCNFISRRTPQLKFEVTKPEVADHSINLHWTSSVARGEAIIRKRRDNQFWIYWELQAVRPGVIAPQPPARFGARPMGRPAPRPPPTIQSTGEWYPLRTYQPPAKIELFTLQLESNLPNNAPLRLAIAPLDQAGLYDGVTPLSRTYTNGTAVSVTAPQSVAGAKFLRWEGADNPSDPSARISLTNDRTLRAIYETVESPAQATAWTGVWVVNDRETVELKQTGDEVVGKYDRGRGTLSGMIKTGTAGETVEGTWKNGASTGTVSILPKSNGNIELRFFLNKEPLDKKIGVKKALP
jgi:hypothetical protein